MWREWSGIAAYTENVEPTDCRLDSELKVEVVAQVDLDGKAADDTLVCSVGGLEFDVIFAEADRSHVWLLSWQHSTWWSKSLLVDAAYDVEQDVAVASDDCARRRWKVMELVPVDGLVNAHWQKPRESQQILEPRHKKMGTNNIRIVLRGGRSKLCMSIL